MKLRSFAIPYLAMLLALAPASAQTYTDPATFPPVSWLETVELQPGRNFDSLIFQTIPGVDYTVFTSEDLLTWTPLGQHYYGLGQQVVIPMVERFTPTSIPAPPPAGPPEPAPVFASLLMDRIPGGLSISFLSADGATPLVYPLPGLAIPPEWDTVPLYVSSTAAGYAFSLHFTGSSQAAPATTPVLSAADQAMVAAFTTRFPDFAAEVAANVQRTRSLPPAPDLPGDHHFYRVTANPFLDSDDDGSPDWLEFANTAAPQPGEPAPNPFDGDTDGDGVPDGKKLDADKDGIPDTEDASSKDKLVTWKKNEPILFAAFPVPGNFSDFQVNDQGTVLTGLNSIWQNGQTLEIKATDDGQLRQCTAYAIGDNGYILGTGLIRLSGNDADHDSRIQVTWPATGGNPMPVKDKDDHYLIPLGQVEPIDVASGAPSDMAVNAQGKFIAYRAKITEPDSQGQKSVVVENPSGPRKVWQIETDGKVKFVEDAPEHAAWMTEQGDFCGRTSDGKFQVGAISFGTTEYKYSRAAYLPDGKLAVFNSFDAAVAAPSMQVKSDPEWVAENDIGQATDVSSEYRFLICPHWSFWHNAPDGVLPGNEVLPGLTGWDSPATCRFIDTTRHGWTLATKQEKPDGPKEMLLAMPLLLSTSSVGMGLDTQSAEANDSHIYSQRVRDGNKNEFWVMIPSGGTLQLKIRSGACAVTPVSLGSTGGIASTPPSISSPEATVTLTVPASAAGQELPIPLKIGSLPSSSIPFKAKVMKARVVPVDVRPVSRPESSSIALPSKEEMETYLNGIYQPQINVTFNVVIHGWQPLPGGVDLDGYFYASKNPGVGQSLVTSAYAEGKNIQVFLMGGFELLYPPGAGGDPLKALNGYTNSPERWVWVGMNHLSSGTPLGKEQWLTTLAHEIGHVLVGEGHPDDKDKPGPAGLPDTDWDIRLMRSGLFLHGPGTGRRTLVKAEWDAAEDWLIENIDIKQPHQ